MSAAPCDFVTVRDLSEATFTYGYASDGMPLRVNVVFVNTILEEGHQSLAGEDKVRIPLRYASCADFSYTEETANKLGKSQGDVVATGEHSLTISHPENRGFGYNDSDGGIYAPDATDNFPDEWDDTISGIGEVIVGLTPVGDVLDAADFAYEEIVEPDSSRFKAGWLFDQESTTGIAQHVYFDVDPGSAPFDIGAYESLEIGAVDNHQQDPVKVLENGFEYTVVP